MVVILLLLSALSNHGEWRIKDITRHQAPLNGRVLVEELDFRISGIRLLGKQGLVLFSAPDKTIQFYDLESGKVKTIATKGQGPREFNGGFVHGTVIGNRIHAYEINDFTYVAFSLEDEDFQPLYKSFWATSSHIQVNEQFIVAVVVRPGTKAGAMEVFHSPKSSLALFEIGEDGTWEYHGAFHEADIMDDERADFWYSLKTDLFNTATQGRFYRVPKWNSPTIQIMDFQGSLVREIPIPHPQAHLLSKSPGGKLLRYKSGKNKLTLDSAAVDEVGNLHLNLQKLFENGQDLSNKVVVKIDEFGRILGVCRLDRKVNFLAVSSDGNTYFALDQETNGLVRFSL